MTILSMPSLEGGHRQYALIRLGQTTRPTGSCDFPAFPSAPDFVWGSSIWSVHGVSAHRERRTTLSVPMHVTFMSGSHFQRRPAILAAQSFSSCFSRGWAHNRHSNTEQRGHANPHTLSAKVQIQAVYSASTGASVASSTGTSVASAVSSAGASVASSAGASVASAASICC